MEKNELIEIAKEARENAYVPYSNFKVGAALLTKDGRIFYGANIENASYGLTICAERNAIFKAISEGVSDFDSIAVIADTEGPVAPCGACRQVMAEFFKSDAIAYLSNLKGDIMEITVNDLLPGAFTPEDLEDE